MPRNPFLPALRRSSYRAPDPEVAREFDLSRAPGPTPEAVDPADRSAVRAAVRAGLDLPEPETTGPTTARSTFSPAPTTDSTVPDPAEPKVAASSASPTPPAGVADDAPHADADGASDGVRTLGRRHRPRHRADRFGNRRPSSGPRRPILAACAMLIVGGTVATGAVVSGLGDDGSADAATRAAEVRQRAAAGSAADIVIPPIDEDPRPVVTTEPSATEAPFTGGTRVTVEGRNLDRVAEVTVAGEPAAIVESDDDSVTFEVPAVDDSVRGTAEVVLADADGARVDVEVPSASAPASVTTSLGGIVEASAPLTADGVDTTPLAITYTGDPGIDAQVHYVLAHWSDYNSGEYPVLSGVDCANFASQSLIARGWEMDGTWNFDRATGQLSAAWSSSTALRDYLRTQTDRATELTDAERDRVKVGDIAQFDWDGSGDRDHTAIVTRVEHTDSGTRIWVGGHTKDADYWDVDEALATGGGTVSYFSLS